MTVMKKILFFGLMMGMLSMIGCKKQEIGDFEIIKVGHFGKLDCHSNSVIGMKNSIVGKWKLVEHLFGYMSQPEVSGSVHDYSCNNIIYHFKEDGTLIVNSDHINFSSSQREYQFSATSLTPYIENPLFNHNYTLKVRYHDYDWDIVIGQIVSFNNLGNRMAIETMGIQPGSIGYSSFIRIE